MIDGGLITGYLLAAVARGGRKILDRTVDAALDRLADAVTAKLGRGPEQDLSRDPGNPVIPATSPGPSNGRRSTTPRSPVTSPSSRFSWTAAVARRPCSTR